MSRAQCARFCALRPRGFMRWWTPGLLPCSVPAKPATARSCLPPQPPSSRLSRPCSRLTWTPSFRTGRGDRAPRPCAPISPISASSRCRPHRRRCSLGRPPIRRALCPGRLPARRQAAAPRAARARQHPGSSRHALSAPRRGSLVMAIVSRISGILGGRAAVPRRRHRWGESGICLVRHRACASRPSAPCHRSRDRRCRLTTARPST